MKQNLVITAAVTGLRDQLDTWSRDSWVVASMCPGDVSGGITTRVIVVLTRDAQTKLDEAVASLMDATSGKSP